VTKAARVRAHRVFDQLWKSKADAGRGIMTRSQAYAWLRRKLKLQGDDEAHIGKLDLAQCELLIKLVHASYPAVRTAWDRLMADPFGEDPEDAAFVEENDEYEEEEEDDFDVPY